jgi:hypothetical protein
MRNRISLLKILITIKIYNRSAFNYLKYRTLDSLILANLVKIKKCFNIAYSQIDYMNVYKIPMVFLMNYQFISTMEFTKV